MFSFGPNTGNLAALLPTKPVTFVTIFRRRWETGDTQQRAYDDEPAFFVREGARWPPSRTGLLCRSGTAVLDLSTASRRASSGFAAIQSGSRSLVESDQPGLNACSFSAFLFFHTHRSRREPRIGGQCPSVSGRRAAESSKGSGGCKKGRSFFLPLVALLNAHTTGTGLRM